MSKEQIHEQFLSLLEQLLPADQIDAFVDACRIPLKKSITINTAKLSPKEFIELTQPRGRHLEACAFTDDPTSFYIDRDNLDTALGRTFLYKAGFFYIQEIAASLPATQLDLQPGDIVLDMAAAPGGKTSQLANMLLRTAQSSGKSPGLVIANDINGKRLSTLAHNVNLGGCYNTMLTKFNGSSFGSNLPNFFDHVLLDAPCSGEGTGYKSDYAMKFWNQAEINKIAGTQFQMLVSALKTVKVGGTVVYSTCTLNPYENEIILSKAQEFFKGNIELIDVHFTGLNDGIAWQEEEFMFDQPEKVKRCWPHLQKTGGFFIAKLRKTGDLPTREKNKQHKLLPKNQFKLDHSKGLQNAFTKWLQEEFGIKTNPQQHLFVATKEKVYLCSPQFKDIMTDLHAEKIGVPVAKIDRNGYRPTHHLGNILGNLATKQVVTMSTEQMQTYSEGADISLADVDMTNTKPDKKYVIIQRNRYGIGIGKIVGEVIKNKFVK